MNFGDKIEKKIWMEWNFPVFINCVIDELKNTIELFLKWLSGDILELRTFKYLND